jgi:catalase
MFYNSLLPVEQQFLINAIRFETSHLKSTTVKQNALTQLNRISNNVAKRVADALGLPAPAPDPTFYHNNVTAGISIFNQTLPTIATLRVGILASVASPDSVKQAQDLKERLGREKLVVTVVGERMADGVEQTYSAADATGFDAVVVAPGTEKLFGPGAAPSPLFPAGRPSQILLDGYRWGKPVGGLGSGAQALNATGVPSTPGVYAGSDAEKFVASLEEGLAKFKVSDGCRHGSGFQRQTLTRRSLPIVSRSTLSKRRLGHEYPVDDNGGSTPR